MVSSSCANANSCEVNRIDLLGQAREVHESECAGVEQVADEVAIGDGVDRVVEGAREAELRRRPLRDRAAGSSRPARPRRAGTRRPRRRPRAAARRRARASRRARPGGGRAGSAARAADACSRAARAPSLARAQATSASCAAATPSASSRAASLAQRRVATATWSLRERPACTLRPSCSELLGQAALEVGVHVLVGRVVRHRGHLGERVDERRGLGGLEQADALEHAHVHLRGEHVVGEERAIDGQRAGEREDGRVELRPDPARPQRARGVGQLGAPALCI